MHLKRFDRFKRVRNDVCDVPYEEKTEMTLSEVIKNDILYGVGVRPSLPCAFDDDKDVEDGNIDPLSDMRHDSWHDASVAMNPTFQRTEQIIEVGSQVENITTDDTSKDE